MNATPEERRARGTIRSKAYADSQTVHSAWIHVGAACIPIPPLTKIFLYSPSWPVGWCVLALIPGLLGIATQVWRGEEWARLVAGFSGIAIATTLAVNPDVLAEPMLARRKAIMVAMLIGSCAASFDLLRPATREELRDVREARARRRAAEARR